MKYFLAFQAFISLVCIFGTCMCHEEQHTVYTLNDAAFVATDLELLDALGAQNISKIMLLGEPYFLSLLPGEYLLLLMGDCGAFVVNVDIIHPEIEI